MKKKLLITTIACMLVGLATLLTYRYTHPNVIHAFTVCGQVMSDGRPLAHHKAELFTWLGGKRYTLENGTLTAWERVDRSRALKTIVLDSNGRFCAEIQPLKYYYKLPEFEIAAMQLANLQENILETGAEKQRPTHLPPSAYLPQPAPEPPKNAINGTVLRRELDQKEQNLRLEVKFEVPKPPYEKR